MEMSGAGRTFGLRPLNGIQQRSVVFEVADEDVFRVWQRLIIVILICGTSTLPDARRKREPFFDRLFEDVIFRWS